MSARAPGRRSRLRRAALALALLAASLAGSGCTHVHTVGRGGGDHVHTSGRVWYFFGVRLNEVDGGFLSGGARDYTIVTQCGPIDIAINIITINLFFTSQTVTVYR